jgi:hypothetical protein
LEAEKFMTDPDTVMFRQIRERAEQIFLKPKSLYPWEEIVNGVRIKGSIRKLYAVAPNTFRSFHRRDKGREGSFAVFKRYFTKEKHTMIQSLSEIFTSEELNSFENELLTRIKERLTNVKSSIAAYNKIRKPIDLYIDHLVAMAEELTPYRAQLVPLLFLPLDSVMFKSEHIFSKNDLRVTGLSRRSTYGSVKDKDTYSKLQGMLVSRAKILSLDIGKPFHRIYFELMWRHRYLKEGGNLFEVSI